MNNLPYPDKESFIGEFESVDMSKLKDKIFGVAIGLSDRESPKFACSSLMAPLDFYEMVEAVANIWQTENIHAKAFILKKELKNGLQLVDSCTIDFIEARYLDILAELIFISDEPKTCQVQLIEAIDDSYKSNSST